MRVKKQFIERVGSGETGIRLPIPRHSQAFVYLFVYVLCQGCVASHDGMELSLGHPAGTPRERAAHLGRALAAGAEEEGEICPPPHAGTK